MASTPKKPKHQTRVQQKTQLPSGKKGSSQPAKSKKEESVGFLQSIDAWVGPRLDIFFTASLILSMVLGALLFDLKISTGGDDSSYIEMAHNFMQGRLFPTWHGPLYSIFLSLPIMLFGVKIFWLKLFSFIFVLLHLILFYKTFKNLVPAASLAMVMLIVAVSSSILYFASQTYSEAMFMFLQALIVFLFLKIYSNTVGLPSASLKEEGLQWFILAFFVFLVSLTRNIGIVSLLAMLFFLLLERRFRSAGLLAVSFAIFLVPYKIYKSLVWDSVSTQSGGQLGEILLKNPYNKALGTEDLSGMITRFFENARIYLSKHFMIGIGLHDPASMEKNWFVVLIVGLLFLITLYIAFRRNKKMLFIAIYLGGCISATFIALQQSWDQMRMVVIYIPMLLLLIIWGIQHLSEKKGYGFLAILLPFFLFLMFFKTLSHSMDKAKANRRVLVRNINGNRYYGFTPDWQNFLRMSEWVGANIPDSALVASRKPSMSFIYSKGRDFYGMYRFPTEVPGEFLPKLISRTGELSVISDTKLSMQWPINEQLAIKKLNVAYVAEGSEVFGVYNLKGDTSGMVADMLDRYQIDPISVDSLLHRVGKSSQSCFAVSADSLLQNLRDQGVDYVIVASLRSNPNMNTGNIINNIQRYLYFIEHKYTGILSLVHQVGQTPQDEPAWLYKINYSLYGL